MIYMIGAAVMRERCFTVFSGAVVREEGSARLSQRPGGTGVSRFHW